MSGHVINALNWCVPFFRCCRGRLKLVFFARRLSARFLFYCKTWQLTARPGWTQTLLVSVSLSQAFKCSISCFRCRPLGLLHFHFGLVIVSEVKFIMASVVQLILLQIETQLSIACIIMTRTLLSFNCKQYYLVLMSIIFHASLLSSQLTLKLSAIFARTPTEAEDLSDSFASGDEDNGRTAVSNKNITNEINGNWMSSTSNSIHEARLKAKAKRRLRKNSSRDSGRGDSLSDNGDIVRGNSVVPTSPKSKLLDRKSRLGKGRGLPKKGKTWLRKSFIGYKVTCTDLNSHIFCCSLPQFMSK